MTPMLPALQLTGLLEPEDLRNEIALAWLRGSREWSRREIESHGFALTRVFLQVGRGVAPLQSLFIAAAQIVASGLLQIEIANQAPDGEALVSTDALVDRFAQQLRELAAHLHRTRATDAAGRTM